MIKRNYALKTSGEAIITFSENECIKGRGDYNKDIISKMIQNNDQLFSFLNDFSKYLEVSSQSGLVVYELWDLESKLRNSKLGIPFVQSENIKKIYDSFSEDIVSAEKLYGDIENGIKYIAKDELNLISNHNPLMGNYLSIFSINNALKKGKPKKNIPISKIGEILKNEKKAKNKKKKFYDKFEIKEDYQKERLCGLLMEDIDILMPGIAVYRLLEKQIEIDCVRNN